MRGNLSLRSTNLRLKDTRKCLKSLLFKDHLDRRRGKKNALVPHRQSSRTRPSSAPTHSRHVPVHGMALVEGKSMTCPVCYSRITGFKRRIARCHTCKTWSYRLNTVGLEPLGQGIIAVWIATAVTFFLLGLAVP